MDLTIIIFIAFLGAMELVTLVGYRRTKSKEASGERNKKWNAAMLYRWHFLGTASWTFVLVSHFLIPNWILLLPDPLGLIVAILMMVSILSWAGMIIPELTGFPPRLKLPNKKIV